MNQRPPIMIQLIRAIGYISDLEYQKRIWIRGEEPEVNNFEETIDFFLDDYEGFKDLATRHKEYGLSDEEFEFLKQFYQKIYDYNELFDGKTDAEVVEDPKWHEVVALAKIVHKKLHRDTDKMPCEE